MFLWVIAWGSIKLWNKMTKNLLPRFLVSPKNKLLAVLKMFCIVRLQIQGRSKAVVTVASRVFVSTNDWRWLTLAARTPISSRVIHRNMGNTLSFPKCLFIIVIVMVVLCMTQHFARYIHVLIIMNWVWDDWLFAWLPCSVLIAELYNLITFVAPYHD